MDDLGFSRRSLYDEHEHATARRLHVRKRRGAARGRVGHAVSGIWRWIRQQRTRREWLILGGKTAGTLFGLGVLYLAVLWFTLPSIDDPTTLFAAQSTVIVDRNDVELYRLYSEEDRTYVELDQIAEPVKRATIAIEDQRFFERGCFDVIGFTRAALSQILPGVFVRSGGSTLTQQFAGNAVVGRQRTITRKIRELMLACQLESRYDKDQLLELYLNWIPYGQNAYGVEQAAQRYFGKSASGLTLAESAVLAALPQLPTYYNPYGNHVRTTVTDDVYADILAGDITESSQIDDDDVSIGLLGDFVGTGSTTVYIGGRTDQVLRNMQDQGMITEEERLAAIESLRTIVFARSREDIRAAHFVLWVREQTEELLGDIDPALLEEGGFTVKTTLDWRLQEEAEKAVVRHHEDNVNLGNAHNVALVSLDPTTREVLAYVGNFDYNDEENEGKIDMARVPRQPGSSFKPFVYALAFEKGYGPGSVIWDIETKLGDDAPQNFDGAYMGLMTMRTALGHSRNIPAAKAFFLAGGEDQVLAFVDTLGVTSPLSYKEEALQRNPDFGYGWPLALGAAEVPLTEMVRGYASFASGGMDGETVSILEIKDRQGNILYQAKPTELSEVMDPRIAVQVTSILSDVDARPANEFWRTQLSLPGIQTAAKTGTSNKCLERNTQGACTLRRPESTWTMGYTPSLVTGVWAGNARSESLSQRADGLGTASPIWRDFMIAAHRVIKSPQTSFLVSPGLTTAQLSLLSGSLPAECTPVSHRKADLVRDELVPSEEDPGCVMLEVDKVTGLLASSACPSDAVEERAFFVPRSEAPSRWPQWESSMQAWVQKEMEKWEADPETHSGSRLPLPLAPTAECDPALTPGRDEVPEITIVYPDDGEGVPYPAFEPEIAVQSTASIREVRFEVDGKPIRTISEGPYNQSIRVPRSIKETGSHTLKVTIVNEFFREASDEVEFRFGESVRRTNDDEESEEESSSSARLDLFRQIGGSGSTVE